MIHSQVTTRVQMGDDSAPDGVVSEDTINGLPSDCQSCETDDDQGNQGLTQRSGSEGYYKKQSLMLHQSLFEPEGDNNMQLKSELMVVKEIFDKIQIGTNRKTKN